MKPLALCCFLFLTCLLLPAEEVSEAAALESFVSDANGEMVDSVGENITVSQFVQGSVFQRVLMGKGRLAAATKRRLTLMAFTDDFMVGSRIMLNASTEDLDADDYTIYGLVLDNKERRKLRTYIEEYLALKARAESEDTHLNEKIGNFRWIAALVGYEGALSFIDPQVELRIVKTESPEHSLYLHIFKKKSSIPARIMYISAATAKNLAVALSDERVAERTAFGEDSDSAEQPPQ